MEMILFQMKRLMNYLKSCADLQKMKGEIKFMNLIIDKSESHILNNNI